MDTASKIKQLSSELSSGREWAAKLREKIGQLSQELQEAEQFIELKTDQLLTVTNKLITPPDQEELIARDNLIIELHDAGMSCADISNHPEVKLHKGNVSRILKKYNRRPKHGGTRVKSLGKHDPGIYDPPTEE